MTKILTESIQWKDIYRQRKPTNRQQKAVYHLNLQTFNILPK